MSLLTELKRRNVIKVGAAYIIVAWLLLQVSDTLVPALHLPDWFHSGVAFLLILGFPVALIFAWAFELTPDGLKREHDVDRTTSISHITGRKLDFAIIGLLAVALGYFIWESRFSETDITAAANTEESAEQGLSADSPGLSIAVLPFADMSPNKDQEYFSDGISEELLNVLARYPGLRVAARTSSFQFKGQNRDIADIARQLRVNHVLEGSVRKANTRLRITAQLIEAETGYHLWSETYDRELDDVFAIQDEISAAIGDALKVRLALDGGEIAAPTVNQAANPEAFEEYIRGRQQLNSRGRPAIEEAVVYLQRSLELDGNYAPAHAQLAIAYSLLSSTSGSYGDFTLEEVRDRAVPHIEKAFELNPNLSEAHAARGLLANHEERFEDAIQSNQRAIELNPSNVDARNWLSLSYQRLGRYKEADDALRGLIEVDPLSVVGRSNYSDDLAVRGRMAEAIAMADSISRQSPRGRFQARGQIAFDGPGNHAESLKWFLQAYALSPTDSFSAGWNAYLFASMKLHEESLRFRKDRRIWAFYSAQQWPEAISLARELLEQDPGNPNLLSFLANALHLSGDIDSAQSHYEDMLQRASGRPIFNLFTSSIATARAAFGRRQAGDSAGAQVLIQMVEEDLRQLERAGKKNDWYYHNAAVVAALDGNRPGVLYNLEQALGIGHRDRSMFMEPVFAEFADDPGFLALKEKLDDLLAEEREKALQMICFDNPVPEAWQPLPETCEGIERA